mmetsp:Transcript_51146/g.116175  ORF Transcript_51146/g.116175 Transcript_51146/m.116175 type:complete len:805 (+) Transcript_51146:138-2552(+)|eukprot:CAMPEP_0204322012 /NCGR_PEP_ID=MMETSP0469-20131031/8461_1 /ASSEMBLY_ACC=CAM_ASM_000384 /TAXON_ID=2969 /ORGANISM="Oxyrrhis marina" /LENGTH=804 /DNA_ID=CAMNT_0051303335 /DNA_START=121 /DNA_END=2535 /DNA_ORIENTATION=-
MVRLFCFLSLAQTEELASGGDARPLQEVWAARGQSVVPVVSVGINCGVAREKSGCLSRAKCGWIEYGDQAPPASFTIEKIESVGNRTKITTAAPHQFRVGTTLRVQKTYVPQINGMTYFVVEADGPGRSLVLEANISKVVKEPIAGQWQAGGFLAEDVAGLSAGCYSWGAYPLCLAWAEAMSMKAATRGLIMKPQCPDHVAENLPDVWNASRRGLPASRFTLLQQSASDQPAGVPGPMAVPQPPSLFNGAPPEPEMPMIPDPQIPQTDTSALEDPAEAASPPTAAGAGAPPAAEPLPQVQETEEQDGEEVEDPPAEVVGGPGTAPVAAVMQVSSAVAPIAQAAPASKCAIKAPDACPTYAARADCMRDGRCGWLAFSAAPMGGSCAPLVGDCKTWRAFIEGEAGKLSMGSFVAQCPSTQEDGAPVCVTGDTKATAPAATLSAAATAPKTEQSKVNSTAPAAPAATVAAPNATVGTPPTTTATPPAAAATHREPKATASSDAAGPVTELDREADRPDAVKIQTPQEQQQAALAEQQAAQIAAIKDAQLNQAIAVESQRLAALKAQEKAVAAQREEAQERVRQILGAQRKLHKEIKIHQLSQKATQAKQEYARATAVRKQAAQMHAIADKAAAKARKDASSAVEAIRMVSSEAPARQSTGAAKMAQQGGKEVVHSVEQDGNDGDDWVNADASAGVQWTASPAAQQKQEQVAKWEQYREQQAAAYKQYQTNLLRQAQMKQIQQAQWAQQVQVANAAKIQAQNVWYFNAMKQWQAKQWQNAQLAAQYKKVQDAAALKRWYDQAKLRGR